MNLLQLQRKSRLSHVKRLRRRVMSGNNLSLGATQIVGCTITEISTLFKAPLTREVADTLFSIADKKIELSDSEIKNVQADRLALSKGNNLSTPEKYENVALFLENPLIKRAFLLMIRKFTPTRIYPGNKSLGTEHATYLDGQPSIEKITAWLRNQKEVRSKIAS